MSYLAEQEQREVSPGGDTREKAGLASPSGMLLCYRPCRSQLAMRPCAEIRVDCQRGVAKEYFIPPPPSTVSSLDRQAPGCAQENGLQRWAGPIWRLWVLACVSPEHERLQHGGPQQEEHQHRGRHHGNAQQGGAVLSSARWKLWGHLQRLSITFA